MIEAIAKTEKLATGNKKQFKKHKTKRRLKNLLVPLLFILPSLLFIIVFSFYPFIKSIVATFTVERISGLEWVGLDIWKLLFSDDRLVKVLGNTFLFAVLNLVFTFCGALFLALITTEKGKNQRLIETLFSLPMAIASAPAAAVWAFILRQDGGVINSLFGSNVGWLVDPKFALFSVAIVTSWAHVASSYILLLAGFRNVPKEVIESAKMDGANPLILAFKIKLPIASPQIFYVLFLNIITAFRTFTQIKLLTGGGPAGATTTLMFDIYEQNAYSYGFACCESLILFAIMFAASRIMFFFEKKHVYYD